MKNYPARLVGESLIMSVEKKNRFGSSLKLVLRETAKKNPLYFEKIQCPVSGRDETGKEIPIDTIGKWIFGVPGYMGHIKCYQEENIKISIPAKAPEEVIELLKWALNEIK